MMPKNHDLGTEVCIQHSIKTCNSQLSLGYIATVGLDIVLVVTVVARADSASQLMTSDVTAVLASNHLQHFTHSVHCRAPQERRVTTVMVPPGHTGRAVLLGALVVDALQPASPRLQT